jgi:outer membrane protein TolC
VLVAMQEVQTGMDSGTLLALASNRADAAAHSSSRALEIADARYNGGLDIYLNVITAQQTLLANQRQAAQIQGQQLVNAVFLVKAMGGGWTAPGE